MSCYMNSSLCWGNESVEIINGNIVAVCAGHMGKKYRKPVVEVRVIDASMEDFNTIDDYLKSFVDESIGDVEIDMFSTDGMGSVSVDVYSSKRKNVSVVENGKPSHLFAVVDVTDRGFDYPIDMLGKGVVINTLTL